MNSPYIGGEKDAWTYYNNTSDHHRSADMCIIDISNTRDICISRSYPYWAYRSILEDNAVHFIIGICDRSDQKFWKGVQMNIFFIFLA